MKNLTVLVVDDDPRIRQLLRMTLEVEGHRVVLAENGEAAIKQMQRAMPDAVILDLVMPDLGGIEVCEWIRQSWDTPIIVLSGQDDETLKVEALDAGADDYVTKPFEQDEFLARIRAVVRRSSKGNNSDDRKVTIEGLMIDLEGRRAFVDGNDLRLTRTEFALLATLAQNLDAVLTHDDLLAKVWGSDFRGANHYLHVYLGRIRKKMGAPLDALLETVPGMGYLLHSRPPKVTA